MKLKTYKHLAFITAAALVTGCGLIYDSLDGCETERGAQYEIRFTFAGGESSDIDPHHVGHLTVYAFDRYGYFVGSQTDTAPETHREDYTLKLRLEHGDDYKFVAWANATAEHGFRPVTDPGSRIDDWSVVVDGSPDNHLMYGALDAATTRAGQMTTCIIELHQHTHTIHLTTEGLAPGDELYQLEMTNNYSGYTFTNLPVTGAQRSYGSVCEKDALSQPFVSARTYAIENEGNVWLYFKNSTKAEILYSGELLELIREANRQGAAIDFTATHNFYIHLKFNPVSMDVSVSLNGWNITEEEHELR